MKHTFASKLLSVILSLCMLFCMIPMFGITASALNATLDEDGTTILISTAEQLAAIGVDANYPRDGAYKLVNDIDLSDFDTDSNPDNGNWKPLCANFSNSSTYKFEDTVAFCGTFDGQGHTISGMNIVDKTSSVAHLGLFAHVTTGAVISNIVFDNCSIDAYVGQSVYAGFVVGYCDKNAKTVNNVAVINSSINGVSRNQNNGSGIGSIAGSGTQIICNNIYSEAVLSGGCEYDGNYQFGIGGLVGGAWRGYVTVNGAVFNGTITNNNRTADYQYANGIYALNGNQSDSRYVTVASKFTNCYYNSDKLTALDTAAEGTVGTNGGHINGTALTTADLSSKKLSELGLSTAYWSKAKGSVILRTTYPDTVPNYPGYIPIYDAGDLAKIGKDAAYPLDGKYFVMNDIDMSDYGNWTPIADPGNTAVNDAKITDGSVKPFTGVFNGGGHTISNMTVNSSGSSVKAGLFGAAYSAVVFKNVCIKDSSVTATASSEGNAGALVGYVHHSGNYAEISNVSVIDTTVTVALSGKSRTFAGSLCGYGCQIQLNNCYSNADLVVYGTEASRTDAIGAGGFVGRTWQNRVKANDCLFEGTIDLSQDVTITEENSTGTALCKAALLGYTTTDVAASYYSDCYYDSSVLTVTDGTRLYNGTAKTSEEINSATAESLGFDSYYWKNDGDGIYLAVTSVDTNKDGKIEIDTAQKLSYIGKYDEYPKNGDYVLTADIDLSEFGNWTPLCGGLSASKATAFLGTFDGQGFKISGMNITGSASNVTAGLFGAVTDNNANNRTLIQNIVFDNCTVNVSGTKSVDAAIVAGITDVDNSNWVDIYNIAIINSSVNGTAAQANYSGIGSVAGNGTGLQMENIYSTANLSGGCAVANDNFGMGGLVGRSWRGYAWAKYSLFNGTITNSTPDTSNYIYANGIFGCNWNQSSYPTTAAGNVSVYYNSEKLTPSTKTNGGSVDGVALDSYDLGISPSSVLGFNSEYWTHDGYTPVLKITGVSEYTTADANFDNVVNVKDLVRLKKYIAGEEDICLIASDLKRDQEINADDLTYLRRTLLGVSIATTIELAESSDSVKYLGRTKSENNILLMDWSNTGFELSGIMEGDVTATLTHVSASAATAEDPFTYARVLVTVDGEESIINVNNGTAVYTLAEDLDFGPHTVKVLKITERTKGRIYGIDVNFVGAIGERPANKDLVIDFYGDSITAGDGVVKNDRACSADYLEGQYSNLTYAAKTAKALNADMRVAANSGLKTKDAVSKLIDAGSWDYENNQADVVVINLGTNDKWVIWDDNNSETEETAAQEYGIAVEKAAIEAMLDAVVAKYPTSKIVWVYGMMGNGLAEYIQPVVEAYAVNNANVFYCELPANTSGGGNHPTEAGHQAAADVLVNFINTNVLVAE